MQGYNTRQSTKHISFIGVPFLQFQHSFNCPIIKFLKSCRDVGFCWLPQTASSIYTTQWSSILSQHPHFRSKIISSIGWKHLLTHISVWQGQYLSNEIAEQEDKDSFNWKSTMNLNLQQIVTLHFVFWVDLRLEKLYFLIFSALSLLFAISIGAVCCVWTSQKGKNI